MNDDREPTAPRDAADPSGAAAPGDAAVSSDAADPAAPSPADMLRLAQQQTWIIFSVLMLAVFGWTIFACGLFPGFLGAALARAGASEAVLAVYYPGAYSLIIGALFVVSGGMWNRVAMIVLGGWIMIVGGAVAPFLGAPANYLVMAFAGGGAFILYGLVLLVGSRWHRAR